MAHEYHYAKEQLDLLDKLAKDLKNKNMKKNWSNKEEIKKAIEKQRPLGKILFLDEEYLKIKFRIIVSNINGSITAITLETTVKKPAELYLIWGNFIEVYDLVKDTEVSTSNIIEFKNF